MCAKRTYANIRDAILYILFFFLLLIFILKTFRETFKEYVLKKLYKSFVYIAHICNINIFYFHNFY